MALFLGVAASVQASDRLIGIGAVGGLPQLLGVDLRYLGSSVLEFGVGFGSVPLNKWVKPYVTLENIPLDLGLDDEYQLEPDASYRLTGFTPFVRLYPFGGAFYVQASYSVWKFSTSITGSLRNLDTDELTAGVVTGNLTIRQTVTTPAIGWRTWISSLYLDFGLGLGILRQTEPSVSIGGSLSSIASASEEGREAFEQAQEDISQAVQDGVNTFREKVSFVPALYLGLGLAF